MGAEEDRNKARILRALNDEIEAVMGRFALRAYQALTTATPVDTGFARGAWTPSLGSASSQTDKAPSDEKEAKAAGDFRLARNTREAQNIARTYQLARGPIYISNNTPYIGRLNEGYSGQAPARFVEAAIEQALRASR